MTSICIFFRRKFRYYADINRCPSGVHSRPSAFVIYVNDIHLVSDTVKSILYADDTTLLGPLCTFKNNTEVSDNDITVSSNINNALDKIGEWLAANKLSLNDSKTKYMLFHFPQRNVSHIEFTLKIDDHPIARVSDFNFLGTTITETLDWSHHIDKISNKVSRIIGIINKLKNVLLRYTLQTMYNYLIVPHFNYCILLWGFNIKILSILQKKSNSHHYMLHCP